MMSGENRKHRQARPAEAQEAAQNRPAADRPAEKTPLPEEAAERVAAEPAGQPPLPEEAAAEPAGAPAAQAPPTEEPSAARLAQQAPLPEETAAMADAPALLAAKTAECASLLDQLKRLAAEYSNFQKRMERHFQEEKRLAVRDLVLDLLPVVDNLERALAHAESQKTLEPLLAGVKAVHQQFLAALGKHGVAQFDAQGQEFDPEHHEAVAVTPSQEHPEGKVVQVVQKGYRLHGQLLRPSRVAVSAGGPKNDGGDAGGGRKTDDAPDK